MSDKSTCEFCKFCDYIEGGSFKGWFGKVHYYPGSGRCKIKPPPGQPHVDPWDWCGDFEDKSEAVTHE